MSSPALTSAVKLRRATPEDAELRVVHPITLMTMGLYNEPVGAYLPSILY